jgi:RNA polymerase sigma-70 factor (ECF subfamily)
MDAEQTQLASPLAAAVESALARLPEDFRLAVLLVDLNDLSYEEAAAALGCPLGTVRSRLFRARKLLYIHLREHARGLGYPTGG